MFGWLFKEKASQKAERPRQLAFAEGHTFTQPNGAQAYRVNFDLYVGDPLTIRTLSPANRSTPDLEAGEIPPYWLTMQLGPAFQ